MKKKIKGDSRSKDVIDEERNKYLVEEEVDYRVNGCEEKEWIFRQKEIIIVQRNKKIVSVNENEEKVRMDAYIYKKKSEKILE